MSKVTSAIANKLLRSLNEELNMMYKFEEQCSTYTEVEGIAPIVPTYDFSDTRKKIRDLEVKICKLKHAINVFNTTTTLEDSGMTVDEALVHMAMLTKDKARLGGMIVPVSKQMKTGFDVRNNQVSYSVINYDVEEVRAEYDRVTKELNDLQLELDLVNATKEFKID